MPHRKGPLTKSDMSTQYTYSPGPTDGDNPHLRGVPDSILLNRNEWYEMLYFCNKFANDHGSGSKTIAQKAERLIQEKVPANLHGRENIRDWLIANWKTAE